MNSNITPAFDNESMISRRRLLFSTGALLAASPFSALAQPVCIPSADMHSHSPAQCGGTFAGHEDGVFSY